MTSRRHTIGLATLLVGALALAACGDDDGGNDNQNNTAAGVCGDGTVDVGEACDDGAENSDTAADACRTTCRLAGCGDGVLDTDEECDEGGANSDLIPEACRRDCRLAGCGDGVLDHGDECDDGNADDGDGCSGSCAVEARYQCDGVPSICTCLNHRTGTDCGQCVVYVDVNATAGARTGGDWANAYLTVQAGVDAAQRSGPGCEVWVAQGDYKVFQSDSDDTIQVPSGVALYGGFAGTETDRGQRDWEANPTSLDGGFGVIGFVSVYHVVSVQDATGVVIDGFRITKRGMSTGDGTDGFGGGILAINAQVTVANCLLFNNGSMPESNIVYFGAALASISSDVTVTNCHFTGNGATFGGAVVTFESTAEFRDCLFTENYADQNGAAIFNFDTEMTVIGCHFVGNRAERFSGSSARGGAMYNSFLSDVRIVNTLFAGNISESPGYALYNSGASVSLTNCTVAGHNGTAIVNTDDPDQPTQFTVTNSIIQHNVTGIQSSLSNPSSVVDLAHSNIQGLAPSGTVINDVPGFTITSGATVTIDEHENGPERITNIYTAPLANWTPNALVGQYLYQDSASSRWALIIANTEQTITTWGGPYGGQSTFVFFDLHLTPGSPCIDTGDDTAPDRLATDFDGIPWADVAGGDTGTTTDMGAREFVP